jgi:hypothetical protein
MNSFYSTVYEITNPSQSIHYSIRIGLGDGGLTSLVYQTNQDSFDSFFLSQKHFTQNFQVKRTGTTLTTIDTTVATIIVNITLNVQSSYWIFRQQTVHYCICCVRSDRIYYSRYYNKLWDCILYIYMQHNSKLLILEY